MPRDARRIQRVLDLFGEVWRQHPDWRMGQLLSNLHGMGPQDVFYWEDDQVEASLKKWLDRTQDYAEARLFGVPVEELRKAMPGPLMAELDAHIRSGADMPPPGLVERLYKEWHEAGCPGTDFYKWSHGQRSPHA